MAMIQHCTASLFRLHLSFVFQFNLRRVLMGGRRKKPETTAYRLLDWDRERGGERTNTLRIARERVEQKHHDDRLALAAAVANHLRVAQVRVASENAVQNNGDRLAAEAAAASPGASCDIDIVNKDEMWARVWDARGTVAFRHEGTGEVRADLPDGVHRCFETF